MSEENMKLCWCHRQLVTQWLVEEPELGFSESKNASLIKYSRAIFDICEGISCLQEILDVMYYF